MFRYKKLIESLKQDDYSRWRMTFAGHLFLGLSPPGFVLISYYLVHTDLCTGNVFGFGGRTCAPTFLGQYTKQVMDFTEASHLILIGFALLPVSVLIWVAVFIVGLLPVLMNLRP